MELARQRAQADTATAPTVWWYETRNFLLMAERRKRLSASEVDVIWQRLTGLAIRFETPNPDISLAIARRNGLTFYDATYVELALRLGLELATRDDAMTRAALSEGVALIGPTA